MHVFVTIGILYNMIVLYFVRSKVCSMGKVVYCGRAVVVEGCNGCSTGSYSHSGMGRKLVSNLALFLVDNKCVSDEDIILVCPSLLSAEAK